MLILRKINALRRHYAAQLGPALRWLANSREAVNFTYHHTPAGLTALTHAVALMYDVPLATVKGWVDTIQNDARLRQRLEAAIAARADPGIESSPGYGRALLTALAVRAARPRLVYEAGTASGLGSVLIGYALLANTDEGDAGRLITADIDARSGWLIDSFADLPIERRLGDSLAVLRDTAAGCDFLLYDTINDARLERAHYELAAGRGVRFAARTLMANWHGSGVLGAFSTEHARRYLAVPMAALDHWHPGSTLGLSVLGAR